MLDKYNVTPIFQTGGSNTDYPDKTDFPEISNADFMTALFGELSGIERPVVVSFAGNPNTAPQSSWYGKPYIEGEPAFPSDANNFTSFAVYVRGENGKYRRKNSQFSALHAVMLDDVGTKVLSDRITLQPSWIIETSSGNFQYGFILSEPVCNPKEANNLLDGIIRAGLCDPGANGACARIGRLPVGINGKHTDWQCKLVGWQPRLRYSVQEIIEGLQVETVETVQQRRSKPKGSKPDQQTDSGDIHIPKAEENPVITALKDGGLYKQALGEGKHDITCPWLDSHTDQVDHGTAYFEPDESYPMGGFKCLHGHCANNRVGALHNFLGISKETAKHLPIVRVQPGEINRIVDIAEIELAKSTRHYQRGGIIVNLTINPSLLEAAVKAVTLSNLMRVLAGLAVWQRYDMRRQEWTTCDPPEKHTKILHDATHYPHLPVLNGIVRQPYFRPDGTLVTQAGHDAGTGMYGVFNASQFNVVTSPTKEAAEQALSELRGLLGEFRFKESKDESAALSGILTASVRQSLRLAPMFHATAPQTASGKTFLCELITQFATPQAISPAGFPDNDAECRKFLLSALLTAPAVIEFDNLTTDIIAYKSLCTALTSESISDRILGVSKIVEVSTRALFLSNGNNVEPVSDMVRRVITIHLDPKCEAPAAMDYMKNPVADVIERRGHFVSLALTIIRAWIAAGKPKASCKPLNSYSEWSDLCRQPLLWLGLDDPAGCVLENLGNDPDKEHLAELIEVWNKYYGNYPTSVKKAVEDSEKSKDLKEILKDIAGERDGTINKNRLGLWIKRHSGRVVDGKRFVADKTTKTNATRWKIESV